ncbi:MAG: TIGR03960 family B12-binding radical SAM protein [Candidatus Omnitrophota bacterium]
MLDDILSQVHKPGRYIGGEWNSSRKDFDKAKIRFALCFPDLYEVGMSNLGIRIIYGILNSIEDVCCERFFSCWHDLEGILRDKRLEILSLESAKRLRDFDIIGFSLGSELAYTNVLTMLELGGIPLESSRRKQQHPLVIAGGPCVLNPEPIHEFFDLFFIGEAESGITELITSYRSQKEGFREGRVSKEELLSNFCRIHGVYVPSLYKVTYNARGGIEEFKPKTDKAPLKVKKAVVQDLNSSFFPVEWLLPYIQIVHDRITLEIMRGCPNSCRFCQARAQYFPPRARSVENILGLAERAYACSGYEELSLGGLSVSDYPGIEELVRELGSLFNHRAVSISLPSIRAKKTLGSLLSLIAKLKKTGLTFAPEAGSERLRRIIAKDFNQEAFFDSLKEAYLAGYQHVKLYFMIGLPFEENDDLDGIVDFALRVSELKRQIKGGPALVNISVNTFIPKPHTPLQWFKMQEEAQIKQKQEYLKSKIRNKRLKINFQNRYMSFLEGVFSRGDRKLSGVISCAFRKGARFDAWGDSFSFKIWLEAFEELKIDPQAYLEGHPTEAVLPWDVIDIGIDKEALLGEFNKTVAMK